MAGSAHGDAAKRNKTFMKPLTFENLRRLMGGGRKKKDRCEASFKRSESFKRISIKKNYLDRGKKHRHQQNVEAAVAATSATVTQTKPPLPPAAKTQVNKKPSPGDVDTLKPPLVKPADGSVNLVIDYNQWLKGMKTDEARSSASSPLSDCKVPTPPPRKRNGSLCGSISTSMDMIKSNADKSHDSLISLSPAPSRADSGLSINLGRIWIDAPMAMAPRSLELPRPLPPTPSNPQDVTRVHHSLDSALKESGRTSRKHCYPPAYVPNALSVSRTLSSSTTHTNKSRDSSGKDSGFSFSISIPKLTDLTSISGGR